MKRIIIIDESANALSIMSEILGLSFDVMTVRSPFELYKTLEPEKYDMLIIGTRPRNSIAYQLLDHIRRTQGFNIGIPAIIISNEFTQEMIVNARKYGVIDLIRRPFEPETFLTRISLLFNRMVPANERVDSITGLHKKAYVKDKVDGYLKESTIGGTMLLLDIDNMSFCSNSLSEEQQKLCADVISRRLSQNTIIGSLGAGGFVVFVKGTTDRHEAQYIADDLIKSLCNEVEGKKLYISEGIAVSGRHGDNFDDLFVSCDRALGMVRQSGKNKATFYFW